MISIPNTPLTEIAATPRKELESKFTFGAGKSNHKYVDLIMMPPLSKISE